MAQVVPKGQAPLGPPTLGHLQHSQSRPTPAPPAYTHLCQTDPFTMGLTGRASMLHKSGAALHMGTRVQTMYASTRMQAYTLLHEMHAETHPQTHRGKCMCTLVHTNALGHRLVTMHSQVPPRPGPAPELF